MVSDSSAQVVTLGNQNISKAPAEKIAEEKAKLEKYEATMKQVQERLAALKK